jgi:hypothetical protein
MSIEMFSYLLYIPIWSPTRDCAQKGGNDKDVIKRTANLALQGGEEVN